MDDGLRFLVTTMVMIGVLVHRLACSQIVTGEKIGRSDLTKIYSHVSL